jgi:hypothetical protein
VLRSCLFCLTLEVSYRRAFSARYCMSFWMGHWAAAKRPGGDVVPRSPKGSRYDSGTRPPMIVLFNPHPVQSGHGGVAKLERDLTATQILPCHPGALDWELYERRSTRALHICHILAPPCASRHPSGTAGVLSPDGAKQYHHRLPPRLLSLQEYISVFSSFGIDKYRGMFSRTRASQ